MRVNNLDDLMDDPHLQAVNMFESRPHHREGAYISTKQPIKFEKSPASIRREPPGLGEHNREILSEVGYTDDEIAALEAQHVVRQM